MYIELMDKCMRTVLLHCTLQMLIAILNGQALQYSNMCFTVNNKTYIHVAIRAQSIATNSQQKQRMTHS